jgi:hypothetical protein
MAFPTRAEYEQLVYVLPHQSAEVASSSLRLYTRSSDTAVVHGSIHFVNGLELRVFEVLDFVAASIGDYSYTVFHGGERVRWYDPQPHPEVPELQTTFPHHRHEPPDIKHNRKPAPGISFDAPNLATLIADCIKLGAVLATDDAARAGT